MSDAVYPEPKFDDHVDAQRKQDAEKAARREARRLRFREEFPLLTAMADPIRETFGPGTRLLWGIEGDRCVGHVPKSELQKHAASGNPLREVRLSDAGDQNGSSAAIGSGEEKAGV
ncbi:hypothetical protein UFOVP119_25 [uncultured Caudovirales phage]|uniref:Uncharacterized protein n=1 Tax=uncultured Caudovirales phage TaxID=2100421 RepID=A0A6J5L7J4_9CAUD|nr:hypothetical protein UFOVP119_25 [uncultured Caudovirales phage]